MLIKEIEFKVAGTTFDNEDRKNRQDVIKDILKTYKENDYFDKSDLWNGYTNKEIEDYLEEPFEYENVAFPAILKGEKYKNEDCIAIYMQDYYEEEHKIGYVPKNMLEEVSNWLNKGLNVSGSLYVTGGRYKEYDNEEDKVVIRELDTYGAKVKLFFSNEEKQNKDAKIQNNSNEKITLLLLNLVGFVGVGGLHDFYLKKYTRACIKLITINWFGIGTIIDLIKIINNNYN